MEFIVFSAYTLPIQSLIMHIWQFSTILQNQTFTNRFYVKKEEKKHLHLRGHTSAVTFYHGILSELEQKTQHNLETADQLKYTFLAVHLITGHSTLHNSVLLTAQVSQIPRKKEAIKKEIREFWFVGQGFKLHQHLLWSYGDFFCFHQWRKTSGAPSCITSGLSRNPSRTTMFRKLAGQLPHMKQSEVPGGIQTHNGEGQVILSQKLEQLSHRRLLNICVFFQ